MAIENWSENIAVARVADDPQFEEDMESLTTALQDRWYDVVVDFSQVTRLNSSNIGSLLRLRKRMIDLERHLILCGVSTKVWGTFIVTGLDKIFQFSDDVATALATLHMGKVG
ncbi:MAG TPA: STAS domain-containing protein [Tepidisphaeraceae bacterium]|nr:STAS domain-containing protein [Tepidisphaeraceae bacterium]